MNRNLGRWIANVASRRSLQALTLISAIGALGYFGPTRSFAATLDPSQIPEATRTKLSSEIQWFRTKITGSRQHDRRAFTQGLLLATDPRGKRVLFESTGAFPKFNPTTLRKLDEATGRVLKIRYRRDSPPGTEDPYFGEGLALHAGRLIQLTYKEGRAFVYDPATFRMLQTFRYEGEGWGLTSDGRQLIMSDGTSTLYLRDPKDFSVLGKIEVTFKGYPLPLINELEFANGLVYANMLGSMCIVGIDIASGVVREVVQVENLHAKLRKERPYAVLNGIAHDPKSNQFYITGKLWPRLYKTRFVHEPQGPGQPEPHLKECWPQS